LSRTRRSVYVWKPFSRRQLTRSHVSRKPYHTDYRPFSARVAPTQGMLKLHRPYANTSDTLDRNKMSIFFFFEFFSWRYSENGRACIRRIDEFRITPAAASLRPRTCTRAVSAIPTTRDRPPWLPDARCVCVFRYESVTTRHVAYSETDY